MKTTMIRTIALLAPLALWGCTVKNADPLPPPAAAHIETFTVSAASVATPGESVTLTWVLHNSTSFSLEQVGKGALSVDAAATTTTATINEDTLFVLTARGEGGTDVKAVAVSLAPQPGALIFQALPSGIAAGGAATLVWNAPNASSATITPTGGTALDLGTQVETGSVRVSPTATTEYTLAAGGKTATVTVTVDPVISDLSVRGNTASPGEKMTIGWKTLGAAQVTLSRAGETAALATVTDAAMAADGTFEDTIPVSLPVNGIVTYTLLAEAGTRSTSQQLQVRVGNQARINTFNVPGYVAGGTSFGVNYTTSNAASAELYVDGVKVFVASTQALVNGTTVIAPAPAGRVPVELVVRGNNGGELRQTKFIEPVGPIAFTSFTADKATIAAGGEAVVLSWNVTNARKVRITEATGRSFVRVREGTTIDTGTLTVYPNRATTTYRLEADNGAGQSITPATVDVTVTAPVSLTFSQNLPPGASVNVTGTTDSAITTLAGLPTVEKNPMGEAFIDIAMTGTPITTSSSSLVNLGGAFTTTLYGNAVSLDRLSVSPYGWMVFRTSSLTGSSTNTPAIGTTLEPLSIAPFWRYLQSPSGSRTWQRDTVADGERLIVQWTGVNYNGDTTKALTFQAQVYTSGKVVFAYKDFSSTLGTVDGTVGITNGSESAEVTLTTPVADGDVYRFFGPATAPQAITIENRAYGAFAQVAGTEWMEVDGDARLTPGRFGISEVHPRPAAAITDGEWVELANYTAGPIDLTGWTLEFGGTNSFAMPAGTTIPANGRIVLAQAADLGDATAGVTATATYPNTLAMADTSGTVSLSFQGGAYSTARWGSTVAGTSVRQDPANAALRYATGYSAPACPGTGTFGTQTGTPGQPDARCFPYGAPVALMASNFEAIAADASAVQLIDETGDDDGVVAALPAGQEVKYFGQTVSSLWVCSNGFVASGTTTSCTFSNKSSPSTTAPVGTIAPYWDDLVGNFSAGSGVYRLFKDPDATPGNGDEYTIISWEGWERYSYVGQLSFQVKFFANGDVEFHYGNIVSTSDFYRGSSATSWIQDLVGGTVASAINVNSTSPGIAANTAFRFAYTP